MKIPPEIQGIVDKIQRLDRTVGEAIRRKFEEIEEGADFLFAYTLSESIIETYPPGSQEADSQLYALAHFIEKTEKNLDIVVLNTFITVIFKEDTFPAEPQWLEILGRARTEFEGELRKELAGAETRLR